MQLWWNPFKKLFPQKEPVEYFLALVLRDLRVEALLFESLKGKIEILGRASGEFSQSIGEIETDELVEVCDQVISSAEENLPLHIITSRTILVLKDDWVSEGRIKKEYLGSLRRLKEDLELEFLGFVVIFEAVCHLLQKEEGVPVTSLLVSKEGENLSLALVRAGRITKLASRKMEEGSFPQNMEKILRSLDSEVLPSRMTLFNGGEDLESLRQELLSFPWTKVLPFLHFPKIELLEEDYVERAVVTGFATQMGVEFEPVLSLRARETVEKSQEVEKEKEQEVFGFVRDKDVLETSEPEEEEKPAPQKLIFPKLKLPELKLPSFWPNLSIFKIFFSFDFFSKARLFLLLPIFLLITAVLVYLFLPQATITLLVNPRTFETEREVTIDPNIKTTEFEKGKIKAAEVSAEVSDTLEGQATGRKEVGEKAKGEVTIYNSSPEKKTFPAGTVITSSNNLKFTLDDKVTLASASGDVFLGTTPAKEKVGVTAVQIGEESNFPSGTTFSIGGLTNVAAKNENAFSGGSKKEVMVVSRLDQENLNKTLLDKLTQKAKGDLLKEEVSSTEKIIETTLAQEILEKKFSKNVDEEASKFSLSLKVKFKTLSFNQKELEDLFEGQLKESVPQDFVLKKGALTFSFGKTRLNKDKSVSSKVALKATLLPKIEEREIKNKIKGKSSDSAFQILATIPNVSDYKIKLSPVFPILPKRLPWRAENIRIEILENV